MVWITNPDVGEKKTKDEKKEKIIFCSHDIRNYTRAPLQKLNPLLRLVRRCSTKVRINFEEDK